VSKHTPFDVDKIRADFPALSMHVYGQPLVYLDNAASAQKPRHVIDRMKTAYETEYANVHRGLHYLANAATDAFEGARDSVRRFINATSCDEIVFTRSATEAINLIASSFGINNIHEGDEIILSIMEHHSNIVPWHFHRERKGAIIRWVPVDENGAFDFEAFKKLLGPRTKIVAITHMSNVLGSITPIKEIIKLAHEHNIPVLVDGSQGAVHLPVDVQDLDADFYVFTGHKVYGPTGIGVLYGKSERLKSLPPFNGGGEMISSVTMESVTYNDPPHRFEAGTPPIVQAIGLGAAVEYMMAIGSQNIIQQENLLRDYAMERLSEINSLKILGTCKNKGAIVSFEMKGAHAHDVATIIDRKGIAVRAGTHCAQPLLARYGATSTCRASFAFYNTTKEIDKLVEALHSAEKLFA
jgi:cysteine desulfurase / selenocysteine lyase